MDRLRLPDSRRPLPPLVTRHRMPPAQNDPPHTPDNRASGLAGVFKNFGRLSRNPSIAPPAGSSTLSPPPNGLISRSSSRKDLASISSDGAAKVGNGGAKTEFENNGELYQQLRPGRPIQERTEAAQQFRHIVQDYSLNSIMGIWAAAKDLTDPLNPPEARTAAFDLLVACIKQADLSALERLRFFQTISEECHPDDFHLQLSALIELSNHGKDLTAFENLTVALLTKWLKHWYTRATEARAKSRTQRDPPPALAISGDEANFTQLFTFVIDVVKFNFKAFLENDVIYLLHEVLAISRKTTKRVDIEQSVIFINVMVTYGYIPRMSVRPCIEVLCGVYSKVRDLEKETWNALSNLCKSHMAQSTIVVLLDILKAPSINKDQNANTIRGALKIVEKLIAADGDEGLPKVPFSLAINAIHESLPQNSALLELDIARAITDFFCNEEFSKIIVEEDWTMALDILVHCSKRTDRSADGKMLDPNAKYFNVDMKDLIDAAGVDKRKKEESARKLRLELSQTLWQVIQQLETVWSRPQYGQEEVVINFFINVHGHIPDSAAEVVIGYYDTEHMCYPSNMDWRANCTRLLQVFLNNRSRPSKLRTLVLTSLKEVYETIRDILDQAVVNDFLLEIFASINEEQDVLVLEKVVEFAVNVAEDADEALFHEIVDKFVDCVIKEQAIATAATPVSPTVASRRGASHLSRSLASPTLASIHADSTPIIPSPAGIVTTGIVSIFLCSYHRSTIKARRSYNELIRIAKGSSCTTDARLNAMRLLFRLRSDVDYKMIVQQSKDRSKPLAGSDELAWAIGRTAEAQARKADADLKSDDASSLRSARTDPSRSTSLGPSQYASSRQNSRSTFPTSRSMQPQQHSTLWLYPEEKPLPQTPSDSASTILFSYCEPVGDIPVEDSIDASPPADMVVLDIKAWLDVIITIFQHPSDWEVYSYVLVYLGSQLCNHTLFKGSIDQVKILRKVLCEHATAQNFFDPPKSLGLKKADVAVCIFQIITMMISYHEHYTKYEQDDIVRTLMMGVGSWDRTARPCIHALTICSYEMPLSISKNLNSILQKMSQIVTRSNLAVHILEFLSSLARLPDLYVNFRDEEFRHVFGVAFRYLQYVRDEREKASKDSGMVSVRSSMASFSSGRFSTPTREYTPSVVSVDMHPNSDGSKELPQYVFALAYHVITFWFMAMKPGDRNKFIPLITKNLVATDDAGREKMEEQSEVTIDMMQRVTYSESVETVMNKHFAANVDGSVVKRIWILGRSIVTIETATTTGVSQVTIRQPSGTSYRLIRPEARHIPHISLDSMSLSSEESRTAVMPSHIYAQLAAGSGQTNESVGPIPLPDNPHVSQAIRVFDRSSTVDGHKIGVIYIGEGQTEEKDILANVMGSSDYTEFVENLGSLTRLKGANFNTQGLDKEFDTDGEFTFCWRDQVSEVVYHVTTMMPTNLAHDPQCAKKKSHTGNDYVNIIFNNSGVQFKFDTFPSQLNYVNIVITPESRASFVTTRMRATEDKQRHFYRVQVMSRDDFPQISPAAEPKMVSEKNLAEFVRNVAINASVFCQVYSDKEAGEHVSSWRNRLHQINNLREKYMSNNSSATTFATSPTFTGSLVSNSPAVGPRDPRRTSGATLLSEISYRTSSAFNLGGGSSGVSEAEEKCRREDMDAITNSSDGGAAGG
jgi:Domain of unknown function (DUF3384)/Rap/ran-GAP/Tuberin